jgi:hypothetical protein
MIHDEDSSIDMTMFPDSKKFQTSIGGEEIPGMYNISCKCLRCVAVTKTKNIVIIDALFCGI